GALAPAAMSVTGSLLLAVEAWLSRIRFLPLPGANGRAFGGLPAGHQGQQEWRLQRRDQPGEQRRPVQLRQGGRGPDEQCDGQTDLDDLAEEEDHRIRLR